LHDFDLSYFLKLLKETGKLEKANIIGIPLTYDEELAVAEVTRLVKRFV
jgi:Ni,Fe-hydrogenase maturation factor